MVITIASLQKGYATLEEKDWMLINEDKRPNLITNQEEPASLTGEVKGGTGGPGMSQDHQTWSDPTAQQKTPSSSCEEGQSGSGH